jgi:antitoxin ParD1/3/4
LEFVLNPHNENRVVWATRPKGMKHSYSVIKFTLEEPPGMSSPKKRTFSLPKEQDAYIERMVKSGAYASASEVVRAGLRSLQERDESVERWLREEVASSYDALKADPSRAKAAKDVFDAVRARHADRKKKTA